MRGPQDLLLNGITLPLRCDSSDARPLNERRAGGGRAAGGRAAAAARCVMETEDLLKSGFYQALHRLYPDLHDRELSLASSACQVEFAWLAAVFFFFFFFFSANFAAAASSFAPF